MSTAAPQDRDTTSTSSPTLSDPFDSDEQLEWGNRKRDGADRLRLHEVIDPIGTTLGYYPRPNPVHQFSTFDSFISEGKSGRAGDDWAWRVFGSMGEAHVVDCEVRTILDPEGQKHFILSLRLMAMPTPFRGYATAVISFAIRTPHDKVKLGNSFDFQLHHQCTPTTVFERGSRRYMDLELATEVWSRMSDETKRDPIQTVISDDGQQATITITDADSDKATRCCSLPPAEGLFGCYLVLFELEVPEDFDYLPFGYELRLYQAETAEEEGEEKSKGIGRGWTSTPLLIPLRFSKPSLSCMSIHCIP